MAILKSGTRVRVVRAGPFSVVPVGSEGTVEGYGQGSGNVIGHYVRVDGRPSFHRTGLWCFVDGELEPIQPLPTAKELMERENAPDFEIRRPAPVYAHLRGEL